MTVPRMNWTIVDALFHVCVLNMMLQSVMSSSCAIDTVGKGIVKDGVDRSIRLVHTCGIVWIAVNATADEENDNFCDVHHKEDSKDDP